MMGDWLQGPYVYALYSSYGFSQHDIAVLFVAGFGPSRRGFWTIAPRPALLSPMVDDNGRASLVQARA